MALYLSWVPIQLNGIWDNSRKYPLRSPKKKNLESGDAEAQKEGQRKNLGNKTEALMYLRFF
jgi:hypothetical protein